MRPWGGGVEGDREVHGDGDGVEVHRGHSAAAEQSGDQGVLPGGVLHHHPHQTGHVHECVTHGGEVGLLSLPGVGGRDHEDDGEVRGTVVQLQLWEGVSTICLLQLSAFFLVKKIALGRKRAPFSE